MTNDSDRCMHAFSLRIESSHFSFLIRHPSNELVASFTSLHSLAQLKSGPSSISVASASAFASIQSTSVSACASFASLLDPCQSDKSGVAIAFAFAFAPLSSSSSS
eukprot:905289_1